MPIDITVTNVAALERIVDYIEDPEGMQILSGTRVTSPGLVEIQPQGYRVDISLPRPAQPIDILLPIRIRNLNPRWSAGLYQKTGYSAGFYGPGDSRYRALGIDFTGHAYFPMYPDYADVTHVTAGHPIVADGADGQDLFIQVTCIRDSPWIWHVAVNNPTDRVITTRMRRAINLPGLIFGRRDLTLQPGEHRFLPNVTWPGTTFQFR
jgi:hypothetical protein